MLEDVLFYVYSTKFWSEHKLLSRFAYVLERRLVFVVIIHEPGAATTLERLIGSHYGYDIISIKYMQGQDVYCFNTNRLWRSMVMWIKTMWLKWVIQGIIGNKGPKGIDSSWTWKGGAWILYLLIGQQRT